MHQSNPSEIRAFLTPGKVWRAKDEAIKSLPRSWAEVTVLQLVHKHSTAPVTVMFHGGLTDSVHYFLDLADFLSKFEPGTPQEKTVSEANPFEAKWPFDTPT